MKISTYRLLVYDAVVDRLNVIWCCACCAVLVCPAAGAYPLTLGRSVASIAEQVLNR
jgi:hypothetical protein